MRWFAWCLMMTFAFAIGCSQPVETIPSVTASTGGVTDSDDEGHEHSDEGKHEHAEGAGHDKAEEHPEGAEVKHAEGDAPPAVEEKKEEAAKEEPAKEEPAKEDGAKEEPAKEEPAKEEPAKKDGASNQSSESIRFVADKSIKVPGMMCPYSCWPKVRETLAAQAGVESVQLASQPEGTAEGEIKERVVELKLNGDFNIDAAVAALGKIDFEAEAIN